MAKPYRVTGLTRLANALVSWISRRGMGRTVVLTTIGRRSGTPRSIPVAPIVVEGVEYLVSPYGDGAWVANVRKDPEVRIVKGRTERRVRLVETAGEEAAAVVAEYYRKEAFARGFMELPDRPSPQDVLDAGGARFPVFEVEEL